MSRFQRTHEQAQARRRKVRNLLIKWALRIGAAFAIGELCPLVPERFATPCHLAGRLISFIAGGH